MKTERFLTDNIEAPFVAPDHVNSDTYIDFLLGPPAFNDKNWTFAPTLHLPDLEPQIRSFADTPHEVYFYNEEKRGMLL